VDHKPHSTADNKPKWGRTFKTYFSHWPVDQTDIFFKPNRAYINSYIDHFARSGDVLGGPAPAPTLTSLSPNTIANGAPNTLLTLTGTGFRAGATVSFGATLYVAGVTVVSPTQITVTILASSLSTAGSRTVTVKNIDGQVSGGQTFTIT